MTSSPYPQSYKRLQICQISTYISAADITPIIIHQTHYEKSDWSRAFNQFTIACELDMINAISAADNTDLGFDNS